MQEFEYIASLITRAKKAQKIAANFTQEEARRS